MTAPDEIVTEEVPSSSPEVTGVWAATYDHARHNALSGVTVPHDADHHPHLRPAPVNTSPAGVVQAAPEPEDAPVAVPVKPVPAPEPARDGEFANGLPRREVLQERS